ncbi:MAG: deoxyhypusine synthase [Candidatus Kariarchaeaceae archaeon]
MSKFSRVKAVKLTDEMSVDELITELSSSGVFGAGKLAKAVQIYTEMLKDKSKVFLGFSGAMVPSGMKKIVCDMISDGMIDVLVSTGANITHDLIEAFGGSHLRDIPYESDEDLREKNIDRILDAFVEDSSFGLLETNIQKILTDIFEKQATDGTLIISTSELIERIGSYITFTDSIVRVAYEHRVPIIVPAYADSILGLQTWLFGQRNRLIIDSMDDLTLIQNIFAEADSASVIFVGGGVPKNYIFQSSLMSSKNFKRAIQLTMDRPEPGGLSGATLSEAISWGKVDFKAGMVTVVSDATITFPMLVAAVRSRKSQWQK